MLTSCAKSPQIKGLGEGFQGLKICNMYTGCHNVKGKSSPSFGNHCAEQSGGNTSTNPCNI